MTQSHERKITGAASIVGGATVLSRILGYIRDAAVAYAFGAGMYADAFFMAFRISNLLRRLVGEGALTSTFIPIFTEEMGERSKEATRDLVSSVFTLFAIILIILTILGVIFSREIVLLMSPGFATDALKFSITVDLTRLMFPYMVFIGLMAIAMGVLNSYRHFAAPAIAPVFFNIAIILCIFAVAPFLDTPVYALAIGVLLGGFLQLFLQFPYLKKYGMTPKPRFHFRDEAIKKIFILMGPAAFGMGVYQLNNFVILWFSSHLAEGSVSYLYYAGRLMELPLGVFGVAVSTAVLPSLSEHVAKKDWEGFRSSLSFALRIVNFVTIPATVGLFVLSYPITEVLFMRGEFGAEASAGTAVALYYYALGLVPVSTSRILTSVFYSVKDTATPVWIAFFAFIVNAILCFLLVGPLGHAGLALATSLSSAVNMVALLLVLKKRFGRFGGRLIFTSALKSSVASLIMGGVIYLIIFKADFGVMGVTFKALLLASCLLIGFLVYIGTARALRTPEMTFLKGILRKRG
ncbi:MAG: murein biosynthesis integral membrane protein MurJ [Deltaproteobacteria bacterium GWB2_55_19]|nr:MAG: murein biosynthesis integral membrane protein MurJ [Deltaproteobacteria bacterium GWB2_55_19]